MARAPRLEDARAAARNLDREDAEGIVMAHAGGPLGLVLLSLIDRAAEGFYRRVLAPTDEAARERAEPLAGPSPSERLEAAALPRLEAAALALRAEYAEAEREAASDPTSERAAHRRQALNMVLGLLEDLAKPEEGEIP